MKYVKDKENYNAFQNLVKIILHNPYMVLTSHEHSFILLFMDMRFKNAIVISFIIHAAIFMPIYNQHLLKLQIEKKNSVIVDYVVLKEIAKSIATNKEVVIKSPETPRLDIRKEIEVNANPENQKKEAFKKQLEARKSKAKEKSRKQDAVRDSVKDAAKKDAELKQNKDYIGYYQLVREKIRSRLKDSYRYYTREGEIYLTFTLTQNGSLLTYSIDRAKSTSDEILLHITAASLKGASPFPAIPRSLSQPKISFSLVISFKK